MDKDFARGERMMRRPDLQQGQQRETDQLQNASGQQNRLQPNWANQGSAWDTSDDNVLPPIPAHLKTNAWRKKNVQLDQTPIVLSNASVSQPQLVAQAKAPEEMWMNSGVAAKGGLEIIPFDGRVVRMDKEGKQVTIPVKYGQPFRMQPGDQLQSHFNLTKFKTQKALTPQQQRDEAIKKMPYGDKLVDAAKMVPDLLKGDAKAAFKSLTTDPAFVAQLVGVSAVFAVAQATPAGPFIDAALIAVLGFSGGLSLANYLIKANSAKDEAGLKASANELKNLIEIVGLAALSGALRTAGKVLGKIKGGTTAEQASRKILFDEMTKAGVKFTPENILKIARGQDGKIIFLETGNSKAGLQHIIEKHGAEFAQKGISEAQIPDTIMAAVTRGKITGYVGKSKTRPIYEVEWQGQQRKIAVTTGSNGFIVGAQIFR